MIARFKCECAACKQREDDEWYKFVSAHEDVEDYVISESVKRRIGEYSMQKEAA